MDLSHDRLLELLNYDAETGKFRWRVDRAPVKAGQIAGCLAKHGYWFIRVDRRLYTGHRLAWFYMTGSWPTEELDHIDTCYANNRFLNLRPASSSQNKGNAKLRNDNTSGFKGVTRSGSKWRAQIETKGRCVYLGEFSEARLASEAYRNAAQSYFGEYARV